MPESQEGGLSGFLFFDKDRFEGKFLKIKKLQCHPGNGVLGSRECMLMGDCEILNNSLNDLPYRALGYPLDFLLGQLLLNHPCNRQIVHQ